MLAVSMADQGFFKGQIEGQYKSRAGEFNERICESHGREMILCLQWLEVEVRIAWLNLVELWANLN